MLTTTKPLFYRLLLINSLFILPFLASAQIGINAAYGNNAPKEWQNNNEDILLSGYSFGIDYWFRLPNRRVEFLPELNYSDKTYHAINVNEATINLTNKAYSFYFNTNLYLLDFDNDCDCPTWEKDGSFIEKGFYLQLSPGVSSHQLEQTSLVSGEETTISSSTISYSIGAGIGVDFGVSKALTITPFLRARYFPNVEFEDLMPTPETSILQYEAGLHLGYRWNDEQTLQRRRRNKRMSKPKKKKRR